MYNDILRRITDAVRRKCLEKLRTEGWRLLYDNAAPHRPGLVKDISAKNTLTTLEYFSFSPDLVPVHLHQFPWLKSALNGQRFCSTTDIIKNVTQELKRLTQNGIQECLQQLHRR
jgi:transposase